MATPTKNSLSTRWASAWYSDIGQAASLVYGEKWYGGYGNDTLTLTWSIPLGTAWYAPDYSYYNEWNDWYILTETEIAGITRALRTWTEVSGLDATRTYDNASTVGELRFARTSKIAPGSYAHAYNPSDVPAGGDVWFGLSWNNDGVSANRPGSYDYLTVLHEIGHAIGLKHPFTASEDNSLIVDARFDSYFYSIMSYSAKPFSITVTADFYPTTPMYLDLVAIQYLYGRETTVRAGNTAYKFTAGQKYWQTIDDAGGNDYILYTGSLKCTIDLRPGKFSILSDQINFSDGTSTRSTVCIGPNTIIETAVGGNNSDILIGNSVNNVLKGGRGFDKLFGGAGNDQLFGGVNDDYLRGDAGRDVFFFNTALSTATASNVDRIVDFNVKDDTIWLDDAVFRGLKRGTLASAYFKIGSRAYDANDKIIYNKSTGDLFYDPDGTGAAAQIKFATLTKGLYLTNADFIIF